MYQGHRTVLVILLIFLERSVYNRGFKFQYSSRWHCRFSFYRLSSNDHSETNPSTLYDILNVSPNASKSEIKRAYIALARQTHPDAQIQSIDANKTSTQYNVTVWDFAQISQAYKILSDPLERMRYDRTLAAAALTSDFEAILDRWSASAGPQVVRGWDKIAMPFLRRSAASAIATIASATEDLLGTSVQLDLAPDGISANNLTSFNTSSLLYTISNISTITNTNNNKKDFSQVFAKAIKAGQRASQAMDRLELLDKSREIQQRVFQEKALMIRKQNELSSILSQRFSLTLSTPTSPMSSMDAWTILQGLQSPQHVGNFNESVVVNITTVKLNSTISTFSFLDSMLHKRSIEYHIEQLKLIEDEYEDKQGLMKQLQQTLEEKSIQVQEAQQKVDLAIQAEESARKALEEAIQQVSSSKARLGHVVKAVSVSEEAYRRAMGDMEKIEYTLERRQERVRLELKRKHDQVGVGTKNQPQQTLPLDTIFSVEGDSYPFDTFSSSSSTPVSDPPGDVVMQTILNDSERIQRNQSLIQSIRQRESELEDEIGRLALKISRMTSRAQKLTERSNKSKV